MARVTRLESEQSAEQLACGFDSRPLRQGVAKLGIALASDARDRRFKSAHPDVESYPRLCMRCGMLLLTRWIYNNHQRKHDKALSDCKKDHSRKLKLIHERGYECEECGNREWNGEQIPIELDHIDGNPDNNVEENLRLLCPNCHAQQPTHAGKNVGKFSGTKRQERQRRYPSYRHRFCGIA